MTPNNTQVMIAWLQYGINLLFYLGMLGICWYGARNQPRRGWGFLAVFAVLKLMRSLPSFRIMPAIAIPRMGLRPWLSLARRIALLDAFLNPVAVAFFLVGLTLLARRQLASSGGK
jgi:hypothetical protein